MTSGSIHSVETFGSVDGPGVRFVIFTAGCRMRCRYCHNADTWDMKKGQLRDPAGILDQAERYRSYWGAKGGITVSGGEPLLQVDFLLDLFMEAKKRGISTCIDTAGEPFSREEPFFPKFVELMKVTDLLLVDIKHIDAVRHRELTGKDNSNIIDMIRFLSEIGKPIWIRQVLVPGWTDDEEDLKKTAQFIRTLGNVERAEVLPYHTLGAYKWEQLGIPYSLKDVGPPAKESVDKAQKILSAAVRRKPSAG